MEEKEQAAQRESGDDRGFSLVGCEEPAFPLLVSVPHAGRDYPPSILENLRIEAEQLLRLEDRYADLLAARIKKAGFPAIVAHRPRAWMDLNRDMDDLDTSLLKNIPSGKKFAVSAKQRGGLGLLPARLSAAGNIWKQPFDYAEIAARIEDYHRPYHAAKEGILRNIRSSFGTAMLVDLHSMPPIVGDGPGPAFVVGDRFGASAAARFALMVQAQLEAAGWSCALNHPYPGDYILRRHGRPARNIHALQLEVDRSLYLRGHLREPGEQIDRIARLLEDICRMLAENLLERDTLLAAE